MGAGSVGVVLGDRQGGGTWQTRKVGGARRESGVVVTEAAAVGMNVSGGIAKAAAKLEMSRSTQRVVMIREACYNTLGLIRKIRG